MMHETKTLTAAVIKLSDYQNRRITHAEYRRLAQSVEEISGNFKFKGAIARTAWNMVRSICGTRATEMPANKFPKVLRALKKSDARIHAMLEMYDALIAWTFDHENDAPFNFTLQAKVNTKSQRQE